MTPRFLNKDRVIQIVAWAALGFCLTIVVGYAIRVISGRHFTLEQVAAVAAILSIPGSLVASGLAYMRSQLKNIREEFKAEVAILRQQLEAYDQLINGILVNQGAHEKLQGHPGIVEAHEKLRGTVLRNEAQVEVFGRFQTIYEQQVKLSEEVAFLKGLGADGSKKNPSH